MENLLLVVHISLTCVDEVLVGHPRVVHIMYSACKDSSHGLQGGEDLHQGGGLHEDVGGLGHVSSMQVVVVGNTLQLRMFLILWICVKIGGELLHGQNLAEN